MKLVYDVVIGKDIVLRIIHYPRSSRIVLQTMIMRHRRRTAFVGETSMKRVARKLFYQNEKDDKYDIVGRHIKPWFDGFGGEKELENVVTMYVGI